MTTTINIYKHIYPKIVKSVRMNICNNKRYYGKKKNYILLGIQFKANHANF